MNPHSILTTIQDWRRLAEASRYRAAGLAKLCRVSSKTLRRLARAQRHGSLRRWLDHLRLRKAKQLILAGKRIKEIAALLGYQQMAQFSRWFKARNGASPRVWRNRLQQSLS